MKTLPVLLGLLFAATVSPLPAQDGPPWQKNGKRNGPRADVALSAEEKQRLSAARERADSDPTVRSLREARDTIGEQLANATRAAMLAADPTLGPTLDKIARARDRAKEMRDRFRSLTPEQRQQLKAARQKAKDDPAVQEAREKMRAAQGPQAKREAGRAVHQAMRAAMLKADPALAPLLDQIGPRGLGGPGGPPPPPDNGEPMEEPGME